MPDDERGDGRAHPTVNQPLNAKPRPKWMPALLLIAFVLALVLLYFLGVTFLVPAD